MRLSKSLKQLITNTARDAYAKGVADGEKRLLTGLKAVAQLNGSFGVVAKAVAHAPAGGVTVQGKEYAGGEFIPGEVMARATPAEKAAVEGGGGDTSKSAGGRAAGGGRAAAIAEAAAAIPVTDDRLVGDEIEWGDWDAVEGVMTDDERDDMASHLESAAEEWAADQTREWEPDDDDRELAAKDADWSDLNIRDKAIALIADLDDDVREHIGEAAESEINDWHFDTRLHGVDAVNELADRLDADGDYAPLAEKVRDLADEAEWDTDDKLEEMRAGKAADYQELFDAQTARREYLQDFFRRHDDEPRFSGGTGEAGVWGRDADGDPMFLFDTSAGDRYKCLAYPTPGTGSRLTDFQFSDESGTFSVTGAGNAVEVFSRVSAAAVSLVTKKGLPALSFTAAEESRRKLYDRLVRTVAAAAPEYAAVAVTPERGPKRYLVVLRDKLPELHGVLAGLAAGTLETLVKAIGRRLPPGVAILPPATPRELEHWHTPTAWTGFGGDAADQPPVRKATADADHSHALLVSAMLQVAEDAAESGDDPTDALRALADLSQDPDRLRDILTGPQVPETGTSKRVHKSWDESKHPRADDGRFGDKPGAAGARGESGPGDAAAGPTDWPRSRPQAVASAEAIRDILMGECDGDTKDWCVTTAEAVKAAFPDAEVWDGNYDGDGDQAHTIFKLGDWFVDVTADQFGGPDVFVARELPEDTYPDFAPTEAGRPAEVGRRMAAAMRAKFARRLEKAWDESLHPRDDSGRFIGKDKLQAAKTDTALAKQLRDKTTDPGERAKLDKVLSGEADPGRTKRGEARHQSQQKRAATEADRRRAHRLAMRAFEPGGLGYDDYEELAGLLPSLTVEQLRAVRSAVGASWGGQRLKRQGMVDTLVAFARQQAAPPEQDAPGSPGWAARMMNREDEPSARVDAWESAKVDDAADRAERMGRWEADRPDSEAAGAVAGAARADLAGARGWAADVATATPGLSSHPPAGNRLDDKLDNPGSKPRPKKRDRRKPVRTLVDAVRRSGGINPASPEFLRFFANAREAVEYGIPLNLFNRETGRHPDQLVTELISEGHLTVPDGADTTQYLFDQMVRGATSEHAILDEAKEKYLADLAREQDEYEAEHGTQPDAYEGGTLSADDLFADEDSGHRGAAGAAGEVPDGGEGSELGDFLGDGDALAFDFGANAEPDAGPVEPTEADLERHRSEAADEARAAVDARNKAEVRAKRLTAQIEKLGRAAGEARDSVRSATRMGDTAQQERWTGEYTRLQQEIAAATDKWQAAKDVVRQTAPTVKEQQSALLARRLADAYPDHYEIGQAVSADGTRTYPAPQRKPPADKPMADPLMGRDAQLDIFGNARRTPRPAKPAVQNSLIPRETERRVEGEETQRAIEAMRDAGNPPEGMPAAPGPSPLNTASPYSLAARDGDRRGHLGRVLAAAGALAPQDALDYATADGDRRVTAAQAEIILSNRLGLGTAAAARAVLATLKPVGTTVVGGGRKRPTYDVLDLFRAVGKLAEPAAGNNPESGHTPSPPVNSPVTGQSGPDTGGEPNGRGQRLSDEVRGGAGGRGGAGVGAGDGPSPGDAPRPPGGSPTGEPAPAGGRPGNRGAGGGPGGGRPGGVAAGGAGAGGGPGGRGPAGGAVPPADGPGGGGGPGRADRGGEVTPPLPALTAPTAYGPQAVVTRGGLVVRDGTGGQKSPSSPVDKMPSTEYTAPESKPSGGKPMSSVATSTGPGVHKIPVQTRLDTDDRGQGVIVRKTDVTEVPKVGTWYRGAVVAAVDKKGKTYHVTTREPTPVEQLAAKAADINAEIYSEQNRGRAPGKEHLDLPLLQAKHDLDAAKLRARGASADEVAKHGAKRPVAVPRLELARQPAAPWMPAGGFVSVIGAAGDSAIVHSEGYDPQTIPLASLRTVAAGGSNPWVKMSREDAQRVVDHFAGLPSGGAA